LYLDITYEEGRVSNEANARFEPIPNTEQRYERIQIGKVPMMLKSRYCALGNHADSELYEFGECPYDQVEIYFRT
jgi:hypothetical protein